LQEGLLELAQQNKTPPDPVAWLFRAVRFRAMNLHRGERRRTRHQELAAAWATDWFVPDPSLPLEIDELQNALHELDADQREIVVARVWGGLSFVQIAEVTGDSRSSVHRQYQRALQQLYHRLSGVGNKEMCDE
jgi:RNA polymerase sigma factor (sigma-70 family)